MSNDERPGRCCGRPMVQIGRGALLFQCDECGNTETAPREGEGNA